MRMRSPFLSRRKRSGRLDLSADWQASTRLVSIFQKILLVFALFSASSLAAQANESLESRLAPEGAAPQADGLESEQLEPPNPPAEAIDPIDPSPHLPGLPSWFVVLALVLISAILASVLFLFLKKSVTQGPLKSRKNPLAIARENLLALRDLPAETPLAELSTRISLTLRRYLADSKSDTALYQTREEFVTDEQRLHHVPEPARSETADFLSDLSALQYAPPSLDPNQGQSLIETALQTLDQLSRPEPTHPDLDA